jgi:hypothetical protein
VPLINHDNVIIRKDTIFKTMEAMKIWLAGYAMFHHRLFMIKYSDENKRYIVLGQFVRGKKKMAVGG